MPKCNLTVRILYSELYSVATYIILYELCVVTYSPFMSHFSHLRDLHNYLHSLSPSHHVHYENGLHIYAWVLALWIKFNNCPTRCDCIQFIVFLSAALHVSGVNTHHQELVQYNCNYSFWHCSTGSTTVRSRCWVGTQQRERMSVDPVDQCHKL